MATLTVQDLIPGVGITSTPAAAGGDAFANDGQVHLFINNADVAVVRNVTFVKQTQSDRDDLVLVKRDYVIQIPTSSMGVSEAVHPNWFNAGTGLVAVTYDDEGQVTVAAVRIPSARS